MLKIYTTFYMILNKEFSVFWLAYQLSLFSSHLLYPMRTKSAPLAQSPDQLHWRAGTPNRTSTENLNQKSHLLVSAAFGTKVSDLQHQ